MSRPFGALSHPIENLTISPTMAIQARSQARALEGHRLARLGLGQSPFPVPGSLVEALSAHASQKDYLPVRGLPALREAVATYHRRRHDLPVGTDDVVIGPGSKELLFLLQLVHDGVLLLPTPAWVSYEPQAKLVGRKVVRLPTLLSDGWQLRPEILDDWCRAHPSVGAILILNAPSNPTGTSYEAPELKALGEVARRHRLIVVSDEIYGELHFQGRHRSIARDYPEGTIIATGLSKWCGAGGWRLGALTFPTELQSLLAAVAGAASETFTSTSAPIQHAAIRAFVGSQELEFYLDRARRILGGLLGWAGARLTEAGAQVVPAVGGFYLFPDFSRFAEPLAARGIHDGPSLAEAVLLEAGVASLPGLAMGRPKDELTLRLALVDFDGARAQAALGREDAVDRGFLEQYAAPTVGGIERLVEWLARLPGR